MSFEMRHKDRTASCGYEYFTSVKGKEYYS